MRIVRRIRRPVRQRRVFKTQSIMSMYYAIGKDLDAILAGKYDDYQYDDWAKYVDDCFKRAVHRLRMVDSLDMIEAALNYTDELIDADKPEDFYYNQVNMVVYFQVVKILKEVTGKKNLREMWKEANAVVEETGLDNLLTHIAQQIEKSKQKVLSGLPQAA